MGIRIGIGSLKIGQPSFSWSSYWNARSLFWSDTLDFVNNKINDKSDHPLNTPSLVKSYCALLDGTGYLGTNYVATVNTELEVGMRFTSLVQSAQYQGYYDGGGNFGFGWMSSTSVKVLFGNKNVTVAGLIPDTLPHVFKLNKTGFYIDGILKYDIAGSGYTFGASGTIYVGSNNGVGTYSDAEIYYVKIRENGTLMREHYCCQGNTTVGDSHAIYDIQGNSVNSMLFLTIQKWTTQNYYHFNLQRGFDVWQKTADGTYMYVPLKSDNTSIRGNGASVGGYTWVAKYIQDGSSFIPAETKLNFPIRAELTDLDLSDLWFNAAKDTANDVGYFDIAQVDFNYFNFRTNKDLIIANKAGKVSYFL
jgi:hypothetical protein